MSELKLPAASGGGSISIKGPSSSSSDVDLLDTSGNLNLEDGKKLILGTGDDFQIHHDGSGTNLDCTNSNPLYIQSDLIHLMREDGNEWYMKCTKDAAVELYYDNSKKLETTSFGATVTGDLTINSSGLNNSSVSGQALQISGTTRPTLILRGNSDGTQVAEIQFADNSGTDDSNTGVRSGLIQYSHASNFMAFRTDATERMRLDSTGALLIGTTSVHGTGKALSITGSDHLMEIQNSSTAGHRTITLRHARASGTTYAEHMVFEENGGGAVGSIQSHGSSTAFNTSSDYRLKENISPISDGITRLKTLKPSRFNFKIAKDTTVDGFLAHEVTAVPEAITGTKDKVDEDDKPIYQQIDQSKLVPLLTAALQEAITEIETLKTKVAALEAG